MSHLLRHEDSIYIVSVEGLAYVKDSKGRPDNVILFIGATINTNDNSAVPRYVVEVFKDREDHFREEYSNYDQAVVKYNELAIKWDGREVKQIIDES